MNKIEHLRKRALQTDRLRIELPCHQVQHVCVTHSDGCVCFVWIRIDSNQIHCKHAKHRIHKYTSTTNCSLVFIHMSFQKLYSCKLIGDTEFSYKPFAPNLTAPFPFLTSTTQLPSLPPAPLTLKAKTPFIFFT